MTRMRNTLELIEKLEGSLRAAGFSEHDDEPSADLKRIYRRALSKYGYQRFWHNEKLRVRTYCWRTGVHVEASYKMTFDRWANSRVEVFGGSYDVWLRKSPEDVAFLVEAVCAEAERRERESK